MRVLLPGWCERESASRDGVGAAAAAGGGAGGGRGPPSSEVQAPDPARRVTPGAGADLGVVGEVRRRRSGRSRHAAGRRARPGPSTVPPVVVLGDQPDPGQVADQGRGRRSRPSRTTSLRCEPTTGLVDLDDLGPSVRSGSPSTATSRSVARSRATRAGAVVRDVRRRSGARPAAPACSQRGRHEPGDLAARAGRSRRSRGRAGRWCAGGRRRRRRGVRSSPARRASAVDGRPPAVSTTRSVVERVRRCRGPARRR